MTISRKVIESVNTAIQMLDELCDATSIADALEPEDMAVADNPGEFIASITGVHGVGSTQHLFAISTIQSLTK